MSSLRQFANQRPLLVTEEANPLELAHETLRGCVAAGLLDHCGEITAAAARIERVFGIHHDQTEEQRAAMIVADLRLSQGWEAQTEWVIAAERAQETVIEIYLSALERRCPNLPLTL